MSVKELKMLTRNCMILTIASVCMICFLTGSAQGVQLPKPIFPTTKAVKKKLVKSYTYSVMEYNPPVKIKVLTNREDASYDTPEQAVIAQLSAMQNLNFEWYFSGWTRESQDYMKNVQFKRHNISPEQMLLAWKKSLVGARFEMTRRVDYWRYVIIETKTIRSQNGNKVSVNSIVLELENGKWKFSQSLKSNPVFQWWNNEDAAKEVENYEILIIPE